MNKFLGNTNEIKFRLSVANQDSNMLLKDNILINGNDKKEYYYFKGNGDDSYINYINFSFTGSHTFLIFAHVKKDENGLFSICYYPFIMADATTIKSILDSCDENKFANCGSIIDILCTLFSFVIDGRYLTSDPSFISTYIKSKDVLTTLESDLIIIREKLNDEIKDR